MNDIIKSIEAAQVKAEVANFHVGDTVKVSVKVIEGPWRRVWQPTPIFLPGESPWTEELGRLYSPWGSKESDTTEAT